MPGAIADRAIAATAGSTLRRVEVRVRRHHLGTDGLSPVRQSLAEPLRVRGPLRGEVVALADVSLEVVQLRPAVLVELDQLELAQADRAAGPAALVAVVRVMPVVRIVPVEGLPI